MNVLLDTLIRPNGETEESEAQTCVTWKHDKSRAVSHVVIGSAARAGGQWVENPVKASWDIGTLSYANMLSLPGYSFAQHHWKVKGKRLPAYLRPSRRAVASYFAAYPSQVDIQDAFRDGQRLSGIKRTADGFYVTSHGLTCKHLVLASGIFSELIPPRPLLHPLLNLPCSVESSGAGNLLVVGSGFSAADVIISTPPGQKIIHIFKWKPETSPSPLRACHQDAYPEYAAVYRRMKLAALSSSASRDRRPKPRKPHSSSLNSSRAWDSNYEGLPNTYITNVQVHGSVATVTMQQEDGSSIGREISGLAYVIGRRGSLDYLDSALRQEVCGDIDSSLISGQSLREKALDNLEVAPNVFLAGSLTGDSLIRFAYGSCTFAAGKIMRTEPADANGVRAWEVTSKGATICRPSMNGLDGHNNGCGPHVHHSEVVLDRRKEY